MKPRPDSFRMSSASGTLAAWWALPLRAIVGYGLLAHGAAKLARGEPAFAAILEAISVPAPHVMAWATILVELVGGFAVLVGAFVQVVAIPISVTMLVAALTVHLPYGFSSIKLVAVTPKGAQFGPPGYETALLYLACVAALALGGAGPFSVEAVLRRTRDDA